VRADTDEKFTERCFVLTHQEICDVQKQRNMQYAEGYHARHGRQPDFSVGVDNVTVEDVREHEGKWMKIKARLAPRIDA
jgi:hypothetical protein